jgi:hypothetical protein
MMLALPVTVGASEVNVPLSLPWAPVRVLASVRKPANGVNIMASVDNSTLTDSGFVVQLSGKPPAPGYKLDVFVEF